MQVGRGLKSLPDMSSNTTPTSMATAEAGATEAHPLRGLLLAMGLGLLALVLFGVELRAHFEGLLSTRISQTAFESVLNAPVLRSRVLFFFGAQALVHVAFGVLAWLCALLAERAFPPLAAHRMGWVVLWFSALLLVAGVANATLYPWSVTGSWFRLLLTLLAGRGWLLAALMTLLCCSLATLLLVAVHRSANRRLGYRIIGWTLVMLLCATVWLRMPVAESADDIAIAADAKPNIIFIGIDSLRADVVGLRGEAGYTPSISAFLSEANAFPETITPLARTFPSWMALLTGRSPARTNVRENLVPREIIKVTPTLADRLRVNGYQTVFATDEVRFSNIDESYGFDHTITPRIGASDFLLGGINDLPLSNLVANTPIAKWLFPDTYANRAAAVTYRPETFITRVDAELQPGSPVFFAAHLTLPHWPYHSARDDTHAFFDAYRQPYPYLGAVIEADRQFSQLMQVLERKGMLRHAIVVLLSDHGEALGIPSDNLIFSREAKQAVGQISVWMNGHGTSVLSPYQYHVVMAVRGYGIPGILDGRRLHENLPLTMEDLAPTIAELVKLPVEENDFDGRSFAAFLGASKPVPDDWVQRIRFTESAYSTPSLRKGNMTEAGLLAEADLFFQVNRANSRLEADPKHWDELLDVKERAAIGPTMVLAAAPAEEKNMHKFVLVPRAGGLPRRLYAAPTAADPAEVRALWQALHERFAGELGAPARDNEPAAL